jgi:hypothetical protein
MVLRRAIPVLPLRDERVSEPDKIGFSELYFIAGFPSDLWQLLGPPGRAQRAILLRLARHSVFLLILGIIHIDRWMQRVEAMRRNCAAISIFTKRRNDS